MAGSLRRLVAGRSERWLRPDPPGAQHDGVGSAHQEDQSRRVCGRGQFPMRLRSAEGLAAQARARILHEVL